MDNPAAKVLVEIAKTQDDTVGDGTTRYINIFVIMLALSINFSCAVTLYINVIISFVN